MPSYALSCLMKIFDISLSAFAGGSPDNPPLRGNRLPSLVAGGDNSFPFAWSGTSER